MIIFIRFDFYKKKVTKLNLKKKQNRTETGSNRPVSVRFGLVFKDKNRFKPVWLGFFGLARFFSGLDWVRFQAYKTETEPAGFFKILIGFLSRFDFFYFFSNFLDLISF
jgi:hypothetical protein